LTDLSRKMFLRPDEAAVYLSVSKRTIYTWIDKGKLQAVRIGKLLRIPQESITKITKIIE